MPRTAHVPPELIEQSINNPLPVINGSQPANFSATGLSLRIKNEIISIHALFHGHHLLLQQ